MLKRCNRCKTYKSLENFTKDKTKSDGLDVRCRDCKRSYESEAYKRFYHRNKEEETKRIGAWRQAHRDEYNKYQRSWCSKGKGAAKTASYRSRKQKATPPWLTEEQKQAINLMYLTCPEGYEVDHIIPLKGKNVCGLHVPWNLQHLPIPQNRKKSNKLFSQECSTLKTE